MWKLYPLNRVIKRHKSGFAIIKPENIEISTPLSCPNCDHLFRSRDDENSYHEFGCCSRCENIWARPRKKDWENGWRPSTEEKANSELLHLPISITFDID